MHKKRCLALIVTLAFAASSASAADRIRLAVQKTGTLAWEIEIMKAHGLDKKMAAMIDDDPASSNNWSGQFGIEIEATTRVSERNVWVKKLN